ncbi:hypothetical protein KIL84_005638 [Mauremys mutica]|uniref:Uncharacterized protein n=1 Tax=Mauremys mutica TaxID=74926 RepID=A0A9D3XHT5_9SAUR|nr:hypothetical protein KIL84_005638 [Mauremys mutica]
MLLPRGIPPQEQDPPAARQTCPDRESGQRGGGWLRSWEFSMGPSQGCQGQRTCSCESAPGHLCHGHCQHPGPKHSGGSHLVHSLNPSWAEPLWDGGATYPAPPGASSYPEGTSPTSARPGVTGQGWGGRAVVLCGDTRSHTCSSA